MDETLKAILAGIGGISVTAVALVSVAYGFFRWFGQKFIEAKFASSLEQFKHEKQKELEQVKFEINKLFDRSTKFHQKEFDVLPTAWVMLEDARAHVSGTVSALQQTPDLSRMQDDRIRILLADNDFKGFEIEEIVASNNPTEALSKHLIWRGFTAAQKATQDCSFYIRRNGIFMPVEIQKQFLAAADMMWQALNEWEFDRRWPVGKPSYSAQHAFGKELPPLMEKLESALRARLSNLSKDVVEDHLT